MRYVYRQMGLIFALLSLMMLALTGCHKEEQTHMVPPPTPEEALKQLPPTASPEKRADTERMAKMAQEMYKKFNVKP